MCSLSHNLRNNAEGNFFWVLSPNIQPGGCLHFLELFLWNAPLTQSIQQLGRALSIREQPNIGGIRTDRLLNRFFVELPTTCNHEELLARGKQSEIHCMQYTISFRGFT